MGFAAFPASAGCLTFECCWDRFFDHLADCVRQYEELERTGVPEKQRDQVFDTCLDGAGISLSKCYDCVNGGGVCGGIANGTADSASPGDVLGAPLLLNGSSLLTVTQPPDGTAQRFVFAIWADAGLHVLDVANGSGDGVGGHGRAVGAIEINGETVVDESLLNGSNGEIHLPVMLRGGRNKVELRLTRADMEVVPHAFVYAQLRPAR